MSRQRMFNYYSDVASFLDEGAVADMEANNSCTVNIDDKCIPNVPLAGRAGAVNANGNPVCPQKTSLICAGNQPYGAPNGWSCAANAASLAQRGV